MDRNGPSGSNKGGGMMGRKLIYGKYTENLVEITMVYAGMANENE